MILKKHLMVIDPAVVEPAIESYNRIATVAPFPVTYHLPALYGTSSLGIYNDNVRGIIVLGSAASVNESHKWQQNISDIMIDASSKGIPVLGLYYGAPADWPHMAEKLDHYGLEKKNKENVLSI